MARNLSQPQIDRRKKVGAELTRATSAIGLGSVAALGAGAVAPKLARGKMGQLTKITEAGAKRFHTKTKSALITAGAVSGGIGGVNGFNNAAWQSAEARQRKQKVMKSESPSPFEDTAFMGEWSSSVDNEEEEVSKAFGQSQIKTPGMGAMRPASTFKPLGQRPVSTNVKNMRKVPLANGGPSKGPAGVGSTAGLSGVAKAGDWKTIDQRERTQGRNRKTMRQAGTVAGLGAGAMLYADHKSPGASNGIGSMAEAGKNTFKLSRSVNGSLGSSAVQGAKSMSNRFKELTPHGKLSAGGAGAIAGAAAVGAGAKGMHTYQQHKINQRRRSNFGKSAFDIAHD